MTCLPLPSNNRSIEALDVVAPRRRLPVLPMLIVALAAANVGSAIAMLLTA